MRSLVLLPVAVLAVLGAFANASLRQPYELTGGAPVLGLAARVADELDAVRVTTNDHSLAAGNPGKGIAADTMPRSRRTRSRTSGSCSSCTRTARPRR
jgi:hypothetical protein